MNPSAANQMILSSDYAGDKVILLRQDTYTSFGSFYSFAHGLPFIPLISLVWSLSPTFDTTYTVGGGPASPNGFIAFDPLCGSAWATSTTVFADFRVYGSFSAIYVRVYAREPSDTSFDLPFTSIQADSFVYNSEFNYTKVLAAGVTPYSSTPSSVEAYTHNLGYYPQCEVWYQNSDGVWALSNLNTDDSVGYFTTASSVTTTDLIMRRDPFPGSPQRFHYRVYVDEL